ncbi:MAG: AAA family ATPase [Pseudomonadota bacterium]
MTKKEKYSWHATNWQRWRDACESGRVPHALLLHGPAGLGKLSFAHAAAEQVLGLASAAQVSAGAADVNEGHPDFHVVTFEAKNAAGDLKTTIGVDQVRAMSQELAVTSHAGGTKVGLVYPAEAMTMAAANSLLKTLEEPPGNTLLLLVTSRPASLLATVRSRCQRLEFSVPERKEAEAFMAAAGCSGDVHRLLDFAGGAPLAALALEKDGFSELDHRLEADLTGIINRSADPVAVAAKWFRLDMALVLHWLDQRVASMIRLAMAGPAANEEGVVPETLARLALALPAARLFHYLDRLRWLKLRIDGPINTQLAVESLLMPWATRFSGGEATRAMESIR